jgi:hypothetical protein
MPRSAVLSGKRERGRRPFAIETEFDQLFGASAGLSIFLSIFFIAW